MDESAIQLDPTYLKQEKAFDRQPETKVSNVGPHADVREIPFRTVCSITDVLYDKSQFSLFSVCRTEIIKFVLRTTMR